MSVPKSSTASPLKYTDVEEIPRIRERLRAGFKSGKLRPIEYRKNQILQLAYLMKENFSRFEEAFAKDLGRPALEASLMELSTTITDCMTAYDNVDKWSKPEGVPFHWSFTVMRPKIYKTPKGVVLIIGPFNYPIVCSLNILAGAIAAGCGAVIKMSELTPTISSLVAELFPIYMDQDLFAVVNGAIPETTALLDLQWDHILFTGSSGVGKVVAAAAAKHLTPVTLELGGQCPVFIDPNTDFKFAAKRLLWGKMVNVGQTCTAPNHVFVPAEAHDAFVQAVAEVYDTFWPNGTSEPGTVGRIVSDRHFGRLKGILDKTNGEIVRGGETDPSQRFIAPTVIKNVKLGDSTLEEELFGPIMPIVPVKSIQEALDYTNSRDHPLSLYIFSQDPKFKKNIIENTQSGAVDVNETVIHMAVPGLPFGGVGASGYGQHTGRFSFETFTHFRSSLDSPRWVDLVFGWRFPPYT
ncbi:hypothetical protein FRB99_006771, partial [Tulasnella sp. 403]